MMSLGLVLDSRRQSSGEAVLTIGGDVTLALNGLTRVFGGSW
jgi:hypothetical protein